MNLRECHADGVVDKPVFPTCGKIGSVLENIWNKSGDREQIFVFRWRRAFFLVSQQAILAICTVCLGKSSVGLVRGRCKSMERPEQSLPVLAGASGERIVLASSSRSRQALLEACGVPFDVDPALVDEEKVKRSLRAENAVAATVAEVLADAKASRVSGRHPGRMVLGADQVLECEETQYDKPATRMEASAQLKALRGRQHSLVSYAVMWRDGRRLWQASDTALMEMRNVSDAFIESYLDAAGGEILNGPGAYRVEEFGVQLFRRIKGDHFTILGLSLLPLLDFLRENRILMT